jgi:arsenate reductase
MAGDRFEAMSAGLDPRDGVHPLAVEVMREIGIDISCQKPKAVDVYLGRVPVNYLIVVCNRAQATCPRIWPGLAEGNRHYWPLDDPAAATGGTEAELAAFRSVRDELQQKLREWIDGVAN